MICKCSRVVPFFINGVCSTCNEQSPDPKKRKRFLMADLTPEEQKAHKKKLARASYLRNRENNIANAKRWQANNPDRHRETVRRYKENNLEKVREADRRHKQKKRAELKTLEEEA